MEESSHAQKEIFPNNAVSGLNENIRFCHFGTSRQYHIYTEKASTDSSFVCPVQDSPGNTDTNTLKAHLCLPAAFTHDICKKFLIP